MADDRPFAIIEGGGGLYYVVGDGNLLHYQLLDAREPEKTGLVTDDDGYDHD